MKYKDYYEILGVDKNADSATIKSAYRKLARKYHPDVNKAPEAQSKFKDINEAYEVLGDKEKRQRYDTLGSSWQGGADFTPPPGFEGFNFSNFGGGAGATSGGFSDFFSAIFGDIMSQQMNSNTSRRGGFSNFGGFGGDFSQFAQGARQQQSSRTSKSKTEENLDIIQNVNLTIDDILYKGPSNELRKMYEELEFYSLIKNSYVPEQDSVNVKIIKDINWIKSH